MLISAKRNLHALIERFVSDERAATAIEYALIASGIGAVLAATVFGLGTNLKTPYTTVSTALK